MKLMPMILVFLISATSLATEQKVPQDEQKDVKRTPAQSRDTKILSTFSRQQGALYKVTDPENGTVCYVVTIGFDGGIDMKCFKKAEL